MSEVVTNPEIQNQPAPVTENAIPQEVRDAMAFAFQEQMPATPEPAAPVQDTPAPTEGQPQGEPTTVVQPAIEAIDDDVYLKQNFNVESRDALKSILEEYNNLKSTATTQAEYKYASDEAKKLAHAINTGDYKTVRQYIEAQELSLDGMTPEQQLKTYIKLQNPLFDQELIEDEFSSNYSVDESDEKYIDNPLQLRKDKLRMEQRKQNDLQNAQKYFSEYKQKAQLPDIQQAQPSIDESYEQHKASTAKAAEILNNVVIPTIKSLKESDLGINLQIVDESNQMNFGVNLSPDKTDFDEAVNKSINFQEWIDSFWNEDGSFNAKKLARAINLEKNFDKYGQSIARQAVNAERKRLIEVDTPAPAVQRNFNMPEEDNDPLKAHWKRAMAV